MFRWPSGGLSTHPETRGGGGGLHLALTTPYTESHVVYG